jgi:hypothetical protein
MSTVGHLTTMVGVFCFYTTLLESTFERKLTVYTHNIIPRLYINKTFILLKKINKQINNIKKTSFPKKKIRKYIKKKSV